ncbi:MAG: hypothetical protein KGL39_47060 [Patescibacteria group bacterium]|nr:hypothetical protein [Patescibacteria group bacterium]
MSGVTVGGSDSNNSANKILAILAVPTILAFFFILLIPISLFNAWALQKMYDWFLLPLGTPALNLWHVWGIMLIIQWFMPIPRTDEKWQKNIGRFIGNIIGTLLMLAVGLIIRGHIG